MLAASLTIVSSNNKKNCETHYRGEEYLLLTTFLLYLYIYYPPLAKY